ncbi:hypothetical protein VC60_gp80 [Mycobacterium phage Sbash]|uniref:Uncharacterized protein n=1 Tax=Mycobacterium phage Sbash TaxID=1567475 RepID=A0A0A7S2I7_9CAUD|nr:hypothetical protein VC60_gp80 [Mycobacterium phage Sbash]AJA43381.1 hypothetical protein PBI_SBASH_80 [Mycobacterium phage Sbash]
MPAARGVGDEHHQTHQEGNTMSNMRIGVLAGRIETARRAIDNLTEVFKGELVPLSPRSQAHRGRTFRAIVVVDPDLWPLSDELSRELSPCLYASGGGFSLWLA